mmetsp:Transcript_16052/g.26700  ORF Transcript_16052/g.26700 Transcript_16052/m.26700 type:complete len:105 (+) Transcript_16052:251-565(+)
MIHTPTYDSQSCTVSFASKGAALVRSYVLAAATNHLAASLREQRKPRPSLQWVSLMLLPLQLLTYRRLFRLHILGRPLLLLHLCEDLRLLLTLDLLLQVLPFLA